MKKNCDCYRIESKREYTYNPTIRDLDRHDITVGVCWGTKEIDECSCGGDRTKCDFYPEVREKAIQEENSLIVTYDHCSPDAPTLCIARKEGDKVRVLNTIQGDIAFGMYHYLTGGAELKNKEIIRCRDCDVPHNKWTGCPKLNGLVTPPDFYCAFAEPKVKNKNKE